MHLFAPISHGVWVWDSGGVFPARDGADRSGSGRDRDVGYHFFQDVRRNGYEDFLVSSPEGAARHLSRAFCKKEIASVKKADPWLCFFVAFFPFGW